MTKANRTTKIAFLATFLLLLVLPDFQMITNWIPSPMLVENRRLSDPPTWSDDLVQKSKKARLWFQDHYGFRNVLIRLKTQMDVSLFGTSDRVVIGEDGWLFARSVLAEEDMIEKRTPAEWQKTIDDFKSLRSRLAARGITLIVVTSEMKDVLYREHLPPALRDEERGQHFKEFRDQLHLLLGDNYIDAEPILRKVKSERQLFHKTDIHWNDPAAFEVAKAIVERIATLDRRKLPFWRYPLKIKIRTTNGSEAMFMPTFLPPTEEALYIDGDYPKVPFALAPKTGPFDSNLAIKAPDAEVLPPTALYGDSFADGMERAGLRDYFRTYYRARRAPGVLPDALQAIPPEAHYFVFQFIEAAILGFDREFPN